jgi:hypothetical protein
MIVMTFIKLGNNEGVHLANEYTTLKVEIRP